MSITGLCQHCENAQASHRCGQCGAVVCTAHYDRSAGSCVKCVGGGLL